MSSTEPACMPYGHWPSPLGIDALFEGAETISCLRPGPVGLFFLLSVPEEGNALALMHLGPAGQRTRVSPAGMNLRSRVHEYAGICYAATDTAVFYCNFSDQRVYRQAFDAGTGSVGTPEPITPAVAGGGLRYADFCVDATRARLLCVREDHRASGEPRNTLVALPCDAPGEGEVLFDGSDFVSSPCVSPDGARLAFQTWSHPAMPWDLTQIQLGAFAADGTLRDLRQVCPERPGALVQPAFSPTGELHFLADWNDWWNLYRLPAGQADTAVDALLPVDAELCGPQWQFGQHAMGGGRIRSPLIRADGGDEFV